MVSSAEEVTAVAVGIATITVKTTNGNKIAIATVNVSSGATIPVSPATANATIKEGTAMTVVFRWTPLVDTGKGDDGVSVAPITSYEITFLPAVSGITQPIVLGAAITTKGISLTLGKTYIFTIKAKNTKGLSEGKTTQISIASAISAPGTPTDLAATSSGITISTIPLTWSAPSIEGKNTDNSESRIKGYTVSYTSAGGTTQNQNSNRLKENTYRISVWDSLRYNGKCYKYCG